MEEISVHDNYVLSYSVDAEERKIVLHTAFRDKEPYELTDITFSGVAAYYFIGDNLRTILFGVSETTVKSILESNRALFASSKRYSWPMNYDSEDDLLEKMSDEKMRAFLIESSYGMAGWVWAKEMSKRIKVVDAKADRR